MNFFVLFCCYFCFSIQFRYIVASTHIFIQFLCSYFHFHTISVSIYCFRMICFFVLLDFVYKAQTLTDPNWTSFSNQVSFCPMNREKKKNYFLRMVISCCIFFVFAFSLFAASSSLFIYFAFHSFWARNSQIRKYFFSALNWICLPQYIIYMHSIVFLFFLWDENISQTIIL